MGGHAAAQLYSACWRLPEREGGWEAVALLEVAGRVAPLLSPEFAPPIAQAPEDADETEYVEDYGNYSAAAIRRTRWGSAAQGFVVENVAIYPSDAMAATSTQVAAVAYGLPPGYRLRVDRWRSNSPLSLSPQTATVLAAGPVSALDALGALLVAEYGATLIGAPYPAPPDP